MVMSTSLIVVIVALVLLILSIVLAVATNSMLNPTYLAVLAGVFLYVVGALVGK